MQYRITVVSCLSENTPTEGTCTFLCEKRKSAVGPDFHPALIVSWFWLREKALFKYMSLERRWGSGYGLVHRSAGCWQLLPVTGAVGRRRWCLTAQRKEIHSTQPSWWQESSLLQDLGPLCLTASSPSQIPECDSLPPPCLPILRSLSIMPPNLSLTLPSLECHLPPRGLPNLWGGKWPSFVPSASVASYHVSHCLREADSPVPQR